MHQHNAFIARKGRGACGWFSGSFAAWKHTVCSRNCERVAPTAEDLCVHISAACLPGFDLPICLLAYNWAAKMVFWSTTKGWILRLLFHLSGYVIPLQQPFIVFIRGFKPDSQGALLQVSVGSCVAMVHHAWIPLHLYENDRVDVTPEICLISDLGGLQSKSTSSPDSQHFFSNSLCPQSVVDLPVPYTCCNMGPREQGQQNRPLQTDKLMRQLYSHLWL